MNYDSRKVLQVNEPFRDLSGSKIVVKAQIHVILDHVAQLDIHGWCRCDHFFSSSTNFQNVQYKFNIIS